jgi:multisubunit Na+/H+ antiporter MnhF subunit
MNYWYLAALGLLLAIIPSAVAISRGELMDRLVALEFATTLGVLALLLIAEGMHRPSFFDFSLTLALLSYPASLLFTHFFERWL